MKEKMLITAVGETGLPEESLCEIRNSMKDRDYPKARELLHKGRETLVAEIHSREDNIRHIDWLIYSLGRTE